MEDIYFLHTTSDGRNIHVFDNVLDHKAQYYFYRYIKNLSYKCNNVDSAVNTNNGFIKFRSDITPEQELDMNFFNAIQSQKCLELIKDYKIHSMYVNLGIPTDCHQLHTDIASSSTNIDECLTLLYYVNCDWNINWGGETLFYNNDLSGIEYTSFFKPGRIILFDGSIPHSARPQSFSSNQYRFTLACKFLK
jgi:Rps23 Pro-64 3,4-dihydroxylase Tpa1-like proline 4-hydroxylase